MSIWRTVIDLHTLSGRVAKESGRSRWRQLCDLAHLRRHNPACSLRSYYDLGVYRHGAEARQFGETIVGRSSSEDLSRSLNPPSTVSVAWDKLTFDIFAATYDLPTPELRALFRESGFAPKHVSTCITSVDDLAAFLSESTNYPMFAKPCVSQQGIGGYLLRDYKAARGLVHVAGIDPVTIPKVIAMTAARSSSHHYQRDAGYLFQQVINQEATLQQLTGTSVVSGVRLVVVRDDVFGTFVHRAVFKVASNDNTHDNFSGGATGNLVCSIQLNSGELGPAITGLWPDAKILDRHPQTSKRFSDYVIPNWEQCKSTVIRASDAIGGMRILHWDLACTDAGPVLLEVNDLGSTYLVQAAGEGILDDRLASILSRHGAVKKFPVIAAAARNLLANR